MNLPAAASQAYGPASSLGDSMNPPSTSRGRALGREDFHCVALNGLGSGLNSYCHTMCWFDGHLFCGSSRATLAMVKVNDPPPDLVHWPTDSPLDVYDLDRRAQLWRLDPATGEWRLIYHSPMVKGRTGQIVARDIGYRGSVVHQGPHDLKPSLYVATWSSSRGIPPQILRSEDGENFEPMPRPDWGDQVNTFRALVSFKGRMFTTPTGATAGYGKAQECVAGAPIVWCCEDLTTAHWVASNPPGFNDDGNLTVFELGVFDDHLYAGTVNADEGFQLWKTKAEGKPPFEWTKVISHGAHRGPHNQIAVSMCELNGALYVGTGIINGGFDRRRQIGPAPAEIIRVHPDDTWDLVVGAARLTPDGLKVPISTFGTGFDSFFNGYVWRMSNHDGHLYVGTFKWTALLPYVPLEKWPDPLQLMVEARGVDEIVRHGGGFDLFRTSDGVNWMPVTRSGFENPFNWGLRTTVSTPYGVFVGSANPFGPEVGVKRNGKWTYEPNTRGAMEIWLGTRDPSTVSNYEIPLPKIPEAIEPKQSIQTEHLEWLSRSGQAKSI